MEIKCPLCNFEFREKLKRETITNCPHCNSALFIKKIQENKLNNVIILPFDFEIHKTGFNFIKPTVDEIDEYLENENNFY